MPKMGFAWMIVAYDLPDSTYSNLSSTSSADDLPVFCFVIYLCHGLQ